MNHPLPQHPGAILHIGAGQCEELPDYLSSGADRIILVEPSPEAAAQLRRYTQNNPKIEVVEAAVSDNPGHNQLREYNLPDANSLHQATGLSQLFPGLRVLKEHTVNTQTPQALLEQCRISGDNNVLVLQAPGAELAIIHALIEHKGLNHFSHLYLTCAEEAQFDTESKADTLLATLQAQGYDLNEKDESNPDLPQWCLSANPLKQKLDELEQQVQAARRTEAELHAKLEASHEAQNRAHSTAQQEAALAQKTIDELKTRLQKAEEAAQQAEEVKHQQRQTSQKQLEELKSRLKTQLQETEKAIERAEVEHKEFEAMKKPGKT